MGSTLSVCNLWVPAYLSYLLLFVLRVLVVVLKVLVRLLAPASPRIRSVSVVRFILFSSCRALWRPVPSRSRSTLTLTLTLHGRCVGAAG